MPPHPPRSATSAVPEPLDLTKDQEDALRRAQLELLAELDRVCKANDVPYFALYGTLLGAVRHQGFIPWDDDLDVGMLREDYERFCSLAPEALGDRFHFQTVDSDPAYGCMFGKLRLNDTRCVDRISYGSRQHGGIFVDVFPLDARATGALSGREQKAMRYVGFRFLYLKAGYLFMRGTSTTSRIIQAIAKTTIRFIPRRLIIASTARHTRLGKASPQQYVSLFGAYDYERDIIDAAWIHPLVELPFEDTTIPAFADSAAYLTKIYGNYLQPPPPEQQVGHHEIVELAFEGGRRAGG